MKTIKFPWFLALLSTLFLTKAEANTWPPVCTMTPPPSIFVGVSPGTCQATVTTTIPTFSPAGCNVGNNLEYSVNNAPFVTVGTNPPPVVTIPNLPAGSNSITWRLLSNTINQTITVFDNIPPTIASMPANFTVTILQASDCIVNYTVAFADNCAVTSVVQTSGLPSGSHFPLGSTTICFTGRDAAFNQASGCFTVTLVDPNPDQDGDGVTLCDGDCDDTDNTIYPGAPEICNNGIDDNCNGTVDENPDTDGDLILDCSDNCPNAYNPGQEDYDGDGIGNDCDPIMSICSAIDLLIAQVQASSIPNGLKNQLIGKLNQAKSKYQSGNIPKAKDRLFDFILLVQSNSGSNIPTALANNWITIAATIRAYLNTNNHNCDISQGIYAPIEDREYVSQDEEYAHTNVFPNPTTGELTLSFAGAAPKAGVVQILDFLGRTLHTETLQPGQQQHQLSMEALPAGVYFIKLLDGGELIWMEKVVKQ